MKRLNKIALTKKLIAYGLTILLFSCQNQKENKNNIINKQIAKPPQPPFVDTSKTLTEKTLLDYIPTATVIKPNLKNGIPFDKLDYDKIIAYDFAGSEEPYPSVIDEKGKFVPVVLKQRALIQRQADKILSTLTSKSTYGNATAACFQPHLALVFVKSNKVINQINVCLDCNYLISSIAIPAQLHKKVNKGTDTEYALTGFTDAGKTAIINLCKELDFSYGSL